LRYVEELGGGALMDLGCYCLHWIRTIAGDEPTVVSASARCATPGVDVDVEAELAFTSGPTATLKCSMQPEDGLLFRRLRVQGDKGQLEFENPVSPALPAPRSRSESDTPSAPQIVAGGETTFHFQLRHVMEVIAGRAQALDRRRRRRQQHARHRCHLPRRRFAAARPRRLRESGWVPRGSFSRSTRAPPVRAR
jgi:predicted dehydrogenase